MKLFVGILVFTISYVCATGIPVIPNGLCIEHAGSQCTMASCNSGYYISADNSSCIECQAGYQCICDICDTREPCPTGTYQPQTGQTSCNTCPAGTFQNEIGQTSCKTCPSGIVNANRTQCIPIDITFDNQEYEACSGNTVRVTWNGYHNICEQNKTLFDDPPGSNNVCKDGIERHGFENNSAVLDFTNLGAEPGQTRYFICSKHPGAKFKVTCTAPVIPNGLCIEHAGSQCTMAICNSGYYKSADNSSCIECQAGYQCICDICDTREPCPTGTFQPQPGQTSCNICSRGLVSADRTQCIESWEYTNIVFQNIENVYEHCIQMKQDFEQNCVQTCNENCKSIKKKYKLQCLIGCTDPDFVEYNNISTIDDGSCSTEKIQGCTDDQYVEFNILATIDDGTCYDLKIEGCTDSAYLEYDGGANFNNGSCSTEKVYGCVNDSYIDYDAAANTMSYCAELIIPGCNDDNYFEYDRNANYPETIPNNMCNNLVFPSTEHITFENVNVQAVAVHNNIMIISEINDGGGAPEKLYVYSRENPSLQVWILEKTLDLPTGGTWAGYSVDVYDRLITVTSSNDEDDSIVYVYHYDFDGWSLNPTALQITESGSTTSSTGNAVSVYGERIAIGSTQRQRVLIYSKDMYNDWTVEQIINDPEMSGMASLERFGRSVALYEDTLAVGKPRDDGCVRVYVQNATGYWTHQQKLSDGQDEELGSSVAIYEDTMVASALGAKKQSGYVMRTAGAVYIYTRTDNTWQQQQKLFKPGDVEYSSWNFGHTISLTKDILAVGTDKTIENFIYIYVRKDNQWTLKQTITVASNMEPSVALNGITLTVGDIANNKAIVYTKKITGCLDNRYANYELYHNSPPESAGNNCSEPLFTDVSWVGGNFENKDFTNNAVSNVDFTGANLKNTDLDGKNLTSVTLTNADLTGADLQNTVLAGKDLTSVTLTNADLTGTDLQNTDLTGKDLTGVTLANADLTGADLQNADLAGKDLTSVTLTNADLTGADLQNADLSGKDLTSVTLTNADLTGADLIGADLAGKDLTSVTLTNADLTATDLQNADLTNKDLTSVTLVHVNFTGATKIGVDLSNKNLTGVTLTGTDLTGATLSGVDFTGKDLTGTDLTNTDLTYATLSGIDFTDTALTGIDFTGATLINAKFQYLTNVTLTNANLTGSIFDTMFDSVNITNAILTNVTGYAYGTFFDGAQTYGKSITFENNGYTTTNAFGIYGDSSQLGNDVSTIGDMNGDGLDDFAVVDNKNVFIIFGTGSGAQLSTANVRNGQGGFVIHPKYSTRDPMFKVAPAGDANGDDKADIVIGNRYGGICSGSGDNIECTGVAYVVFGKDTTDDIHLGDIFEDTNTGGYAIVPTTHSILKNLFLGISVTGGHDADKDGKPDIVVGTDTFQGGEGAVFVIYGKSDGYQVNIAVGSDGYARSLTIESQSTTAGYYIYIWKFDKTYDGIGAMLAMGDVDDDSYADIIIGSSSSGYVAVIWGKGRNITGRPVSWLYDNIWIGYVIVGTDGFFIESGTTRAVECADVNGDGISDIIISKNTADGSVSIIFGTSNWVHTEQERIDISSTKDNNVFTIRGFGSHELGSSLSTGDVNGDGKADILIGSKQCSSCNGLIYVVYGKNDTNNIYLSSFPNDNTEGYVIYGQEQGDYAGVSIAGGDINGDGKSDVLVGASKIYQEKGMVYVIFARNEDFTITDVKLNEGCTDSNYFEYNAIAPLDTTPTSCVTLKVFGCTDSNYLEHNAANNIDTTPTSCATLKVFGCMDSSYLEYNAAANIDTTPSNCTHILGCTDSSYLEHDPIASADDGSCARLKVFGCMNSSYIEYKAAANIDTTPTSCATLKVFGCTDSNYLEHNAAANIDTTPTSCSTLKVFGCMDSNYKEYNATANIDTVPSHCLNLGVSCTVDGITFNHNANHTFYTNQTVRWSEVGYCQSKSITCNDGTLSDSAYVYASCSKNINLATFDVTTDGRLIYGWTDGICSVKDIIHRNSDTATTLGIICTYGVWRQHTYLYKLSAESTSPKELFFRWPTWVRGGNIFSYTMNAEPATAIIRTETDRSQLTAVKYVSNSTYAIVDENAALVFGGDTAHTIYLVDSIDYSYLKRIQDIWSYKFHYWNTINNIGDVNGDGYQDILLGAPTINSNNGQATVLYGPTFKDNCNSDSRCIIKRTDISEIRGYNINGNIDNGELGLSASALGDINNDGIDDFAVAAPGAGNGRIYVIFGESTTAARGTDYDLPSTGSMPVSKGYTILGALPSTSSGVLGRAGDFNGDEINDILIGSFNALGSGKAGGAYVVFGNNVNDVQLKDIQDGDNTRGIFIAGIHDGDMTGWDVKSAGDINADGKSDVLIVARDMNAPGNDQGAAYVIYGTSTAANINLIDIRDGNGSRGFAINGMGANEKIEYADTYPDLNGDNKREIIISSSQASGTSGETYVIYS